MNFKQQLNQRHLKIFQGKGYSSSSKYRPKGNGGDIVATASSGGTVRRTILHGWRLVHGDVRQGAVLVMESFHGQSQKQQGQLTE